MPVFWLTMCMDSLLVKRSTAVTVCPRCDWGVFIDRALIWPSLAACYVRNVTAMLCVR